MPLDFSKVPVDESPSPLKRLVTPIVDQLPSGVKEGLESFAHPGLHTSVPGAMLKGFLTGSAEAITPAHVAAAATLSPELLGANAATKALSLGGNLVSGAQG